MPMRKKSRAGRPNASSWEKVSARKSDQTLSHRDVHEGQQLDRGHLAPQKSKWPALVACILLGALLFAAVWFLLSIVTVAVTGMKSATEGISKADEQAGTSTISIGAELANAAKLKILISGSSTTLVLLVVGTKLFKRVDAGNLMSDTSDINQHENDQHIALPEEIQRKFDWFPDAGAHSSVQVSSMISHIMLTNKGLKKVPVTQRVVQDTYDKDGDLIAYQGEPLSLDRTGTVASKKLPLIDERFGSELFDASGLPPEKQLRKTYDTTGITYNPDSQDRDKLPGYQRVSDLINGDWDFPGYEVQRPAGAYLVDTAPVNTMVLAITRAGKGQTYIEPVIDMWLREKRPSNMVINDPKGELLVKNYVPAVTRGYDVVQFNLINPLKTDIYNPLGMAADAAREGDSTKCAMYVENIAEVFFPASEGDDPVWQSSANNAFKRAVYGLIDFYLEEERELRTVAAQTGEDVEVLDKKLDDMWGKVTLYNCYQLFVQLASKKLRNPMMELKQRMEAGEFDDDEAGLEEEYDRVERQAFLWEGQPEQDMLSLYFNASETLPRNTMRTLVGNAHNSLRSMGGAEKMLASVYGIAITAMSFFTDPTISTLTSGKPSQNVDLGGLSFPRRIGVRFSGDYLKRDHLIGLQARWAAYADSAYTQPLGAEFEHSDVVTREGWARCYFQGKFPQQQAWLKLELVNPQTKMLVRTFYFEFTKSFQTSLSGRHFVTEPVTGKKVIKNGLLRELKPDQPGAPFRPGDTVFPHTRLDLTTSPPRKQAVASRAIIANMVRYSEAPKAVFLVTPPHLQKYAKLILILIKQLVDLNFDRSYMTKGNQKPLYKTRFMLDELGNLQSEGKGITGFETMLSIGLGQEQQFTLILQTLQQLRDVYGESVDKIVQGNCLPLDAKIATPTGWTTMEKVQPGDEVMTPFGTTTSVTNKYAVKVRPVYRLALRDGSSVEACPDHLWPVERWQSSIKYVGGKDENGKRAYVGAGPDGKTIERVEEIISTEELKARLDKGRHVDLIPIAPVAYPEADLPIDPYVLGAILGDGHIQPNGVVKFGCGDAEIVEEIRRRGYTVVDDLVHGQRKDGIGYRINGVNAALRDLDVAGKRAWEKSIPEQYLLGSVQQRTDLLRGLMDTDGTISQTGEMEFTSSSRQLAEDAQTIVRSLGGRVAINYKTGITYTSPNQATPKEARDAYRVQNIRLPEINPFLLPRKAVRWKDRTRACNRVISVEYLREDLVQCIEVADERHLYLTDDFIPTHNTSNIVFLKSTDDSMIETLEKMSGKKHKSYIDSKQITRDVERLAMRNEGRVTYTMNTKEEPVISYNDMAFIPDRNSIVFRAGDAPVWNRNETILPMSWRLLRDNITHPGHDYTLQTLPTNSSAADFDVRTNQPDFVKMLEKRIKQAEQVAGAKALYQESYGYSDFDLERLDPDIYAAEVMEIVEAMIAAEAGLDPNQPNFLDLDSYGGTIDSEGLLDNVELKQDLHVRSVRDAEMQRPSYAAGTISRSMLISRNGIGKVGSLDREFSEAYKQVMVELERDYEHFSVAPDGTLCSADGRVPFISAVRSESLQEALVTFNASAQDESSRVYAEGHVDEDDLSSIATIEVHPGFYEFLASLPSWQVLAGGEFERAVAQQMQERLRG